MTLRSALELQRAVEDFRDTVTRDGGSCTLTGPDGVSVTIGPRSGVPTVGADQNDTDRCTSPAAADAAPTSRSKKTKAGPISAERLKSFIERIEKLEEERKAIGGDIKDVYSEAKGVGYDVKTMRKIVQLRGMDAADRAEAETLLDIYKHALGMV
jgi:uncharacterized protein (UPF0335 family)